MTNEVSIILTATDKASAVLNKAEGETKSLGQGWMDAAKAAGVAALAYKGFDILKTTVTDTVKYAETVRDLSRALGINSEEASKLLQIADDLKIEQGQLQMAFRYAINKGVDPSIEGLKKLAKEYQSISDPIAKAQFAMEKFGTRGGLQMQKVLELTTEKIDEMAQSAEDAGLVLSGEAVQSARDFEIAMDGLNDTAEGLKIQLGTALIPVITDVANEISRTIGETMTFDKTIQQLELSEKSGIITHEELVSIINQIRTGTVDLDKVSQDLTASLHEQAGESYENIIAREKMKTATDNLTLSTEDVTTAEDLEKQKIAELNSKLNDLKTFIAGPLSDEYDNFVQKNEDLRAKGEELRAKIAELEGMEYLTDEQKEELDGLKIDLGEVSDAMTANADAHDEATARILFNLLQQQLAIDGWTDDELKLLTDVGNRWGLIDDRTLEATEGMAAALKAYAESGDLKAFLRAMDKVKDKVDAIPRTVNVNIHYSETGKVPKYKPVPAKQFGGPVSAGMPYLVGEGGPELFVPSSSGTIINNFNLTANYASRERQSLAMDIKMLAAMYG